MSTARVVAVVALVVLAGCGAGTPSSSTASETQTVTNTPIPTTTTPTATPTPTQQATGYEYDNPWNEPRIEVYVINPTDRDFQPLVTQALSWWEEHNTEYTQYDRVTFEYTQSRSDAELVIRFGEITRCDSPGDPAAGCAPRPSGRTFSTQSVAADINTGYANASTLKIVKHEIGHTLGLPHDTGPEFMVPETELATLPRTDAAEKSNPWEQSEVAVYVDRSAVPEPLNDTVVEQMEHVFTYFNSGGEGATPADVKLVRADTRSEADIDVNVVRNTEIEDRKYAEGRWYGTDPDSDDRIETVTNGTISVAYNVNDNRGYIGWATGYWVAVMLDADYENPPPPWSDDSITYRDDWWTRAG